MMDNTIIKSLVFNNQVRLFFVDNTKLISDILNLNKKTKKAQKLTLGKTLSAVSLMSGTFKDDQRISLQMTMSNTKHKVFADADANENVRGYLSEALLKEPIDTSIKHLIGHNSTIRMIKGSAMNQFTGITDMPYQNIDDDISHYFIQSEQTQTYIKTHIKFSNDDNFLLSNAIFAQLLPGAPLSLMNEVKQIINTNQAFFNTISGPNIEGKLIDLFSDMNVIGYSPVQFFCGCSKEMFYGMLHSLSKEELEEAINNKEPINTVCQICGRNYSFEKIEIQELI